MIHSICIVIVAVFFSSVISTSQDGTQNNQHSKRIARLMLQQHERYSGTEKAQIQKHKRASRVPVVPGHSVVTKNQQVSELAQRAVDVLFSCSGSPVQADEVKNYMIVSEKSALATLCNLATVSTGFTTHIGTDGRTPFIQAVISNNFKVAMALKNGGIDIKKPSLLGMTPVAYAVRPEYSVMLNHLIAHFKLSPDATPGSDPVLSPLIIAATGGYSEAVECLLEQNVSLTDPLLIGGDVLKTPFTQGGAALMSALLSGKGDYIEVVRQLLAADVHPDQMGIHVGDELITPFMYVLRHKKFAIADMLAASGADVDKQSSRGKTALMHAAQRGHKDVVEKLVERYDARVTNQLSDQFDSPLTLAARFGRTDVVDYLIPQIDLTRVLCERFDKPGSFVEEGVEALQRAALGGHLLTVEALLGAGVSPKKRGKHGYSTYDAVYNQYASSNGKSSSDELAILKLLEDACLKQ